MTRSYLSQSTRRIGCHRIHHPLRVQRQPVQLGLHRTNDPRMTMAKGKYSKTAETVDELASIEVAQETSFALPLDDCAGDAAWFGPTIEIVIEVLYAFRDDLRLLFIRKFVTNADFH